MYLVHGLKSSDENIVVFVNFVKNLISELEKYPKHGKKYKDINNFSTNKIVLQVSASIGLI